MDFPSRQTISTLQEIIKDKSELVPDKSREKRDKMSSDSRTHKKNRILEVNNNNSDDSETVQMKKLSKEFWTLNQASEVERQRLGELVTLLTARLKLAEDKTTEAEANLREEKLKCARAEIAAERAQIDLRDSGKLTSSMSSTRSDSGFRSKLVEDVEKMSVEDLRWEVVRLKEELRAKRRELGEARGGREEMVRIYKQMLEDTRQVYRQTLSDS